MKKVLEWTTFDECPIGFWVCAFAGLELIVMIVLSIIKAI